MIRKTARPEDFYEPLLRPGEVALMFQVSPKTVARWAALGQLTSIRTPGGHHRFREAEIRKLLEAAS